MIPDSGQSRPATADNDSQQEPSEDSNKVEAPQPPSPATDNGAVRVSHRAAKKVAIPSHLHHAKKLDEGSLSPKGKLQYKLLDTLSLYRNDRRPESETMEAFSQRIRKLQGHHNPETLTILLDKIKQFDEQSSYIENIHCGQQLAVALLQLKLEDAKGLTGTIESLYGQYSEVLPDFIELLQLNHEYTFNPSAFENEDKLNYFCGLAQKVGFMPSTWLLTKLALKPGSVVSPALIIDMLTSLESVSKVNCVITSAFILDADDIDVVLNYAKADNATEYHQALWVFASLFNEKQKSYWPGPPEGFSPELQKSLLTCLSCTLMEQRSSRFEQYKPEEFDSERKNNPKRLHQWQAEMERLCRIHDLKAAEKDSSLGSYQRDLSGLIMAWHYKQDFILRKADPLKCAELLRKAAKRGNFKLLYMDAAKIFANYGRYDDALNCLNALLRNPLSPEHHKMVMHYYETYSLTREAGISHGESEGAAGNEWLPEHLTAPQAGARKKTSTKGKGKKGKGKGKGSEKERSESTKQKQPAQKDEKPKADIPEAAETSKPNSPEASPKPSLEVTEASQAERPSTSSTLISPELARATTEPDTQTLYQTLYQPEGGWLPDGHPEVSRLYSEINSFQDSCNLEQEAKTISRWLKRSRGKPLYGRVCEEAAWFYIRQMESSVPGMCALEGDTIKKRPDMAKLAGQWLSRTEACYFQAPRGRGTNPDELKELIINTYSHHTDWQEDPEYRKRIRCICSSRGHLYSNLSAYASEGQYSWSQHQKLTNRYRAFYQLKELADPAFSPMRLNPAFLKSDTSQ